jgi:uncharacterized membrane protein
MVSKVHDIPIASAIAATYTVSTVMLGPFGYSWMQVRIGEALTPLPYLFGFPAIAGLTIGCVIANIFSPIGLPDLILGPFLTLVAAILSYKLSFNKKVVACIYPVVINAFGVSAYVAVFYGISYEISVLSIGLGEAIAAILIGYPLLCAIERISAHLNFLKINDKEETKKHTELEGLEKAIK